jgi:hypothetical protein
VESANNRGRKIGMPTNNLEVLKDSDSNIQYPICSMVLEYLPTFAVKIHPNVGKYTIHGAYGIS